MIGVFIQKAESVHRHAQMEDDMKTQEEQLMTMTIGAMHLSAQNAGRCQKPGESPGTDLPWHLQREQGSADTWILVFWLPGQ